MSKYSTAFYGILYLTCIQLMVFGDVYLHNPRGSNNRLNENSANRKNANRAFDSQNNNRGGYNVGDATDEPAGDDPSKQYQMKYFQSAPSNQKGRSYLTIEWTNQHGCGGNDATDPHKQNCNIVLQYMCQPLEGEQVGKAQDVSALDSMRDGTSTSQQGYTKPRSNAESVDDVTERYEADVQADRVLQESWFWYDKCYRRERNKGLFTADQVLRRNSLKYCAAVHTRQNPQGTRRGYECPEERDYYPYWHPAPWIDIAVLTDQTELCSYYQSESHNVMPRHECVELYPDQPTRAKHWSRYNNQPDCVAAGGQWTAFYNYLERASGYTSETSCKSASSSTSNGVRYIWALPYHMSSTGELTLEPQCLVALDRPECKQAPWTRSNHLGNSRGGEASRYTWTIPHYPSANLQQCVYRIRYNISTDDYSPQSTDARSNQNRALGIISPVQQNPIVDVAGPGYTPLRLAINTAQLGRTFQDRSHLFVLRPRPSELGDSAAAHIYNLNVRGKRGNIVQTFPAVEYDFIPNELRITRRDLLHVQWTGSNTHNNGRPGGDGQTGDAGEGAGGTDRHNLVQILDRADSYPAPYESSTLWSGAELVWPVHSGGNKPSSMDLALMMATAGYYRCFTAETCPAAAVVSSESVSSEELEPLDAQLNNARASFEGAVIRVSRRGSYHYMCTRNNNFSNRSQKGTLVVE